MSKFGKVAALVKTLQNFGTVRELGGSVPHLSGTSCVAGVQRPFFQHSTRPSACRPFISSICDGRLSHGSSSAGQMLLQDSEKTSNYQTYRNFLPATTEGQKPRLVVFGTGCAGGKFTRDTVDPALYNLVCISPRNHMVFTPLLASSYVGTREFRSVVERVRKIQPAIAKYDDRLLPLTQCAHTVPHYRIEQVRRYAKSVAMPSHLQKPMKLRNFLRSPGVIGEPYRKRPPQLPFLQGWFTREGWSRRRNSFMAMIKTSYTIAKLRQKNKGYSQQKFYQEVSDSYQQINEALAEGERTKLRHLVTDSIFSGMKNELKHREAAWAKVKWEMVMPIKNIRTMQGRLIALDKKNTDNAFVQMTLRILSKQKFAAYDKRGKLVAGDPDKEVLVEDYWVFEKPLLQVDSKWLLCGRLSL